MRIPVSSEITVSQIIGVEDDGFWKKYEMVVNRETSMLTVALARRDELEVSSSFAPSIDITCFEEHVTRVSTTRGY